MKVFIVEGACGEYDDYVEWPVAAYLVEELAKAHVKGAEEGFLNLKKIYGFYDIPNDVKNPYDPSMNVSYTGPKYYYYALEISDALPNVK
jgi:hypothetical protein